MAELRVENPSLTERFCADLAERGVKLPLRLCDEDVGVILDADGADVLTVDVNGERSDFDASAIALWIVCAVNTCGGFKVEVRADA